jgi:hypothetical protein
MKVQGGATFSSCEKYRYCLTRWWGEGHRLEAKYINFICLNPSTATAEVSDPTVTRLIARVTQLGFERLVVTNIFAFRSTDPRNLRKVDDPNGPDNDTALLNFAKGATMVVCGWSGNRAAKWRGPKVRAMLTGAGIELYALRIGKDGAPCHPLYLPYELKPQRWEL